MQKVSFALEFSDAIECANFFTAFAEAVRNIAGGVKRAVAATVEEFNADGAPDNAEGDPATPDKPRRTRRTKAEMEAARAAEAAASSAPAATPAAAPAFASELAADHLLDGPDGIREAGNAVLKAKGPTAVADILNKFGIKKYPQCPPARRQELLDALKAVA